MHAEEKRERRERMGKLGISPETELSKQIGSRQHHKTQQAEMGVAIPTYELRHDKLDEEDLQPEKWVAVRRTTRQRQAEAVGRHGTRLSREKPGSSWDEPGFSYEKPD
jgi:hypothetical protein